VGKKTKNGVVVALEQGFKKTAALLTGEREKNSPNHRNGERCKKEEDKGFDRRWDCFAKCEVKGGLFKKKRDRE